MSSRYIRARLGRSAAIALTCFFFQGPGPGLGLGMSTRALAADESASAEDPDADYDRLDGHGKSGKTIQVIEWEGNLEIHSYPVGALKGLAMKLDDREKGKLVMVIGYRFKDNPGVQYVRRAILGVPFRAGFKAYRDSSAEADGYDKIIVTNQGMDSSMASYRLEAPPSQMYPDGHPVLADGGHSGEGGPKRAPGGVAGASAPPSSPASSKKSASGKKAPPRQADSESDSSSPSPADDSGTIRPFFTGGK